MITWEKGEGDFLPTFLRQLFPRRGIANRITSWGCHSVSAWQNNLFVQNMKTRTTFLIASPLTRVVMRTFKRDSSTWLGALLVSNNMRPICGVTH
mmetsp:Transcript_1018/g.2119  ORF Transcript_1018/g.2119 Transcript_1018/m.2119 type:complete len:95 (+) Transcript_1018:279-563(+)